MNDGQNPKFWEQVKLNNVNNFKYQRKQFKKIVATHGDNSQLRISELIKNEWKHFLNNYPNLPFGKSMQLLNYYPSLPFGKTSTQ